MMAGTLGRRTFILRSSRDIERVKKQGRRVTTVLCNLLILRSEFPRSRMGIIVGRRFGTAVRRNRAKRLFRELERQVRPDFVPGAEFLVFPKREVLLHPFNVLKEKWIFTLQRQGLLRIGQK